MPDFLLFMKAFLIGASMLVPGVSGGTMSMVFGVYDRLISSVSSFRKHKKESALFLLQFILGAGTAFLLLSGPMAALSRRYPEKMAFFVTGAVIGGIPVIWRETKEETLSFKSFVYLFSGLLLVVLLNRLPENLFASGNSGFLSVVIQLLAGVLGALALVLPGISFSSMLYMMGVYKTILGAIGNRDFLMLLPFGAGCILGILFLTQLLEKAMKKKPHLTYMIILGFVIGSVGDIMGAVRAPLNGEKFFLSLILATAGFLFIRILSKWERI